MNKVLLEVYGHLGAALAQSLPTDDEIIIEHLRQAHEILKECLHSEPELLEALKIAHAVLTNQGGGDGRNAEQIAAAESAIAKAERRS